MIIRDIYEVEEVPSNVPQATAKGLSSFIEAGSGLTTHWGLYSLLGAHEWCYFNDRIPFETYHQLMEKFNPTRFHAEEWADLVLEAGM